MPSSYLKKEKEKQLKAFSLNQKKYKNTHNISDSAQAFFKFDCDDFASLKLELEKLDFKALPMGLIFAQTFNLFIKIVRQSSSNPPLKFNADKYARIFSSSMMNGAIYLDGYEEKKYVENIAVFLDKFNVPRYFFQSIDLKIEDSQFWIDVVAKIPHYEKYFNPKNGLFLNEAKDYIKNVAPLLEKADLALNLNLEENKKSSLKFSKI